MIQSTTDYNKFKFYEHNRKIDSFNLKQIIKSIQIRNLLKIRPILVDEKFFVIDGQHRLEAAKELELPIYYQIDESAQIEDVILLNNNMKKWCAGDYLNFYIQKNKSEYIKLNDYMKNKKLSLPEALSLFSATGGKRYGVFKEGKFSFDIPVDNLDEKIVQLHHIQNMIKDKYIGVNSFRKQPTFIKSFFYLTNLKPFDFSVFVTKLELKINWLHSCSKGNDYITIFKEIYNYRNNNPI